MKRVQLKAPAASTQHQIGDAEREKNLLYEEDASPPYPAPWPIKVYDIGKVGFVGVRYPDCWQEHTIKWWHAKMVAAGVDLPPHLRLDAPRIQLRKST